jgi:hypothetical protein
MADQQFKELTGRIDGVARVVMTLICQLEDSNTLNGERLDRLLRSLAENRNTAEQAVSSQVVRQMADQLVTSRRNRSLAH